MITAEEIRNALRKVMDPELGRNIVDLGMVRDVTVSDEHEVNITLALTTVACPLKNRIVDDIKAAIHGLDGALVVNVKLAEMNAKEKDRLMGARQAPEPIAAAFNDINHVIAVMSGKGGVGKSSVSALLAVALRKRGERVGVLDADLTGPSIPKMFGLHHVRGMSPLGLLPAVSSTGVKVMSINLLLSREDEAVIWRGPLITGAIRQFWGDVLWEKLDTLILDLPPGTSDVTLTVMQSIPLSGVLLVTSPQDLAGMIVRKAASMAQQLNIPIIGLIENMSYVQCPDCGRHIEAFGPSRADETARALGVPFLGQVPLDPELARRCDSGEIESYPVDVFAPIVTLVSELVPDVKCKPQI
jgi:Mrp family chromosome partitioning ATPase